MREQLIATYSIVARDAATGGLGVAVQSCYLAVGAAVPWGEAGVGVVATQSFANLDFGPEGLAMMREGIAPADALRRLLEGDQRGETRQVALLDSSGRIATHTGAACVAAAGHLTDDGVSVQANMMTDDTVWPAMLCAYRHAGGDLAARLVTALEAAEATGGDIRGRQSAALLVVSGSRAHKPLAGPVVRFAGRRPSGPVRRNCSAASPEAGTKRTTTIFGSRSGGANRRRGCSAT